MTDRQDWQQPQYPQQGYGEQYPQEQPWQPRQYEPGVHQQRIEPPQESWPPQCQQRPQQYDPYAQQQTALSPQAPPQQSWPQPHGRHAPQPAAARKTGLTAAESFWYVLMCIPMGAAYWAKIPAKKALQDFGMARMTTAEQFWYVLMCIAFGGGYWAKIPIKKALSEMGYPA
jgi:hypothetical protein